MGEMSAFNMMVTDNEFMNCECPSHKDHRGVIVANPKYCQCDSELFMGKVFHMSDPFANILCPYCGKIISDAGSIEEIKLGG